MPGLLTNFQRLGAPGASEHSQLPTHAVPRLARFAGRNSLLIQAAAANDGNQQEIRRLIMMRHADSERPLLSQDHARPITQDGRRAAQQVAQKLQSKGWLPQFILCSTAVRTVQTLETMRDAVAAFGKADTHARGSLFTVAAMDGMTLQHLQEIVGDIVGQAHVACLMCLGHNKGWEEVVSLLTKSKVKLGTSHAALLEGVAPSWESAFSEDTKWRLVDLLTPEPQSDVPETDSQTPLPQPS